MKTEYPPYPFIKRIPDVDDGESQKKITRAQIAEFNFLRWLRRMPESAWLKRGAWIMTGHLYTTPK